MNKMTSESKSKKINVSKNNSKHMGSCSTVYLFVCRFFSASARIARFDDFSRFHVRIYDEKSSEHRDNSNCKEKYRQ